MHVIVLLTGEELRQLIGSVIPEHRLMAGFSQPEFGVVEGDFRIATLTDIVFRVPGKKIVVTTHMPQSKEIS